VGHRVTGHESKCANFHGHNYTIHITCAGILNSVDSVGRVIDFAVIKDICCAWLEDIWDHRFLLWEHDPDRATVTTANLSGFVFVPFNPTAENMAKHLLHKFNELFRIHHKPVECIRIRIDETPKCSAEYMLEVDRAEQLR
jgi:6-pyruvoyltetrahydropterin/6-carboxytetrahydropterin synthase